jgi:hypothetical protein
MNPKRDAADRNSAKILPEDLIGAIKHANAGADILNINAVGVFSAPHQLPVNIAMAPTSSQAVGGSMFGDWAYRASCYCWR